MKLASLKRYSTFRASGSISRRDRGCSERGTTVGATMERGLYQMPGCQGRQVHALQRVRAVAGIWAAIAVFLAAPVSGPGRPWNTRASSTTRASTTRRSSSPPSSGATPRPNGANLVLGRSYLERFRQSSDRADLVAAREALREVRPSTLGGREQAEYLVGLGESLYLEESYGAAAEIFVTAFERSRELGPRGFDRVFDWWATSLDRLAQSGLVEDMDALYRRNPLPRPSGACANTEPRCPRILAGRRHPVARRHRPGLGRRGSRVGEGAARRRPRRGAAGRPGPRRAPGHHPRTRATVGFDGPGARTACGAPAPGVGRDEEGLEPALTGGRRADPTSAPRGRTEAPISSLAPGRTPAARTRIAPTAKLERCATSSWRPSPPERARSARSAPPAGRHGRGRIRGRGGCSGLR